MRVPLLRQAFSDPSVKIAFRAMDSDWHYRKVVPMASSGFNPYHLAVYVNRHSSLGDWIATGCRNDRKFNEGDLLTREALFLIHDYLHCWAVLAVQEEMPKLGFGTGKITRKNLEDHAFCHLLTEAVATVGLDYWFLAANDLDSLCEIGTTFSDLTVRYQEKDLPEFRRFDPDFSAQSPEMFEKLAVFYCTGEFPGFSLGDIRRSAKLFRWLEHEISYGQTQRRYTRAWLKHLGGLVDDESEKELGRPLAIDRPWQKKLIRKVGESLWRKVKEGEMRKFRKAPRSRKPWQAPEKTDPDYRFTNLNRLALPKGLPKANGPRHALNFHHFFCQFVGAHRFDAFPSDLLPVLQMIREKKDARSLVSLFKDLRVRRVAGNRKREPVDLFFLG